MKQKTPIAQSVLEAARERIRTAYTLFDEIVVMFSGGKDSTVVLNLALEAARELGRTPLTCVFYDEEAIPPETVEYVARVAALPDIRMRWLCVSVKHRNATSRQTPWWYPWREADRAKWVRPMPANDYVETDAHMIGKWRHPTTPEIGGYLFPPDRRFGLLFGIRASESLTRHRGVVWRTYLNYINPCPPVDAGQPSQRHCSMVKPIYDWKTEDVWTAPKVFGWDYNRAYDVMRMAGVSAAVQRCAPPFGEEPLQSLWTYAVCWPDLWERMIDRVPGAAAAARYSRSPLYEFGGTFLDDVDPKFVIERLLAQHGPDVQVVLRKQINKWMNYHAWMQPKDPIPLQEAGCSGVSWRFLRTIASRGNTKGRRTPSCKSKADYEAAKARRVTNNPRARKK
jgi:predicted phosphoadenosine phosphosulfate sulfurtransferase